VEIEKEIIKFFQNLFSARSENLIENQLCGVEKYLRMFDQEANDALYRLVSFEKIHSRFKSFTRDKCLGLDSWTVG